MLNKLEEKLQILEECLSYLATYAGNDLHPGRGIYFEVARQAAFDITAEIQEMIKGLSLTSTPVVSAA